ncbi:MAG: hypothetical protein ACRETJ_06940 [Steroidobacteraceae bacterium]
MSPTVAHRVCDAGAMIGESPLPPQAPGLGIGLDANALLARRAG